MSNPNWEICQWIDYCSGPDVEGLTQLEPYSTRWGVWLNRTSGVVEYSIVGNARMNAPTSLFPDPVSGGNAASLAFDQDALPAFAIGFVDEHIEVRRTILGVPHTYTFDGITPRLFFNGVLLESSSPDSDIVCYYVRNSIIYSRYQRDNFGVEYAATNFPYQVLSIKKVDTKIYREILYVKRLVDVYFTQNFAIRSLLYPVPPVFTGDTGTLLSAISSGRYLYIIVDGGTYHEASTLESAIATGRYFDAIVTTSASDDSTLDSVIASGTYVLVIIEGGTYAEASTLNSIVASGSYDLIIIDGGTYAEAGTLTSAITAGDYHT